MKYLTMIQIFAISYNEERLVGFFIDWYKTRFPGCEITIFDNESADRTKEIAESKGCKVLSYSTGGKMDERSLRAIKNVCWKGASCNWVAVVDIDELVEINYTDLMMEEKKGTTMIDFEYWTVVNKTGESLLQNMNYGVHHKGLTSKRCLFNPRAIQEINYEIGAHVAHPIGHVQLSSKKYRFFHYKFLSYEWLVSRFAAYRSRLTDEAIKNNWGIQYRFSKFRIWWEWNKLKFQAKRFK
jgi:Glycosyl transferase family 2